MRKQTEVLDEAGYQANMDRLQAIAASVFGDLSDEAILEILAERRLITQENAGYQEQKVQEAEKRAAENAERVSLEQAIAKLNALITPDQDDDSLLSLVKQRKELEQKLAALQGPVHEDETKTAAAVGSEAAPVPEPIGAPVIFSAQKEVPVSGTPEVVPEEIPETLPVVAAGTEGEEAVSSVAKDAPRVLDTSIGREQISVEAESDEEAHYLQFLQASPEEALARLETLPVELRKNKAFMLKVAAVDPAYAMHYADAKTLKRDEDFNIVVAGMKNPRSSGNPLAEMLSDMRTSKVVMAAIKNDFRNLRYATPTMEGYADMIEVAKQEARERAHSIGQAIDIRMFLPKTLRDDREFLEEIESIIKGK